MSKEIIDKVLDQVSYIHIVGFTGGEPTLRFSLIRYFFEQAKKLGKMPEAFWLATNGKKNQWELAKLLLQYYPEMEDKESCGVALSLDNYHDKLSEFPVVNLTT